MSPPLTFHLRLIIQFVLIAIQYDPVQSSKQMYVR